MASDTRKRLLELHRQRQFQVLLQELEAFIKTHPNDVLAWKLAGDTFRKLGRSKDAVAAFRRAARLAPNHYGAYNNLGVILSEQGQLDEAVMHFDRAGQLSPDVLFPQFEGVHYRRAMCDWSEIDAVPKLIEKALSSDQAIAPWGLLFLEDDPQRHHLHSLRYASFIGLNKPAMRPAARAGEKIRLGYFSADIAAHATAYLIAGLLQHHDRDRFEIYLYSYGHRQDSWTQALAERVDKFSDVKALSDQDLVSLARKDALDIAIDLKGYTQYTRLTPFAAGVAPVQMTYLGYPGTLASPCFDYVIADDMVIPAAERKHYSERVIYMPHSYQATDSKRVVAPQKTHRPQWGLPEEAIVFCCMNHNTKICPQVFDIWMNVLKEVPGAVLWLLEANKWATKNLRHEAQKRGVEPGRLIFTARVPPELHLERLRHADIFLDTFVCNAHTTASDALYVGLPLITKAGRQFAARVGASLLKAVGLSELITTSDAEYEACILALAKDRARLKAMRQKLEATRLHSPLFDTARFARNFEAGLIEAYQRSIDAQPPADIWVKEPAIPL